MNETIQTVLKHQSIRRYAERPVEEEKMQNIFDTIQASPSWINGQQISIIRVTNPEIRQQLATLCGNQSYVANAPEFLVFCADFYRTSLACEMEKELFAAAENMDLLLVGATDVGIALGSAVVVAESLGLGTVPIGGIRRNTEHVIELLKLPKYVIPISGLCIGYPLENPGLKPRLPKQSVVFNNAYNTDLHGDLKTYDEIYSNYMHQRTNGQNSNGWTNGIATFYREPFYRDNSYQNIEPTLVKQGFLKTNQD